jgi:hypothetical protein
MGRRFAEGGRDRVLWRSFKWSDVERLADYSQNADDHQQDRDDQSERGWKSASTVNASPRTDNYGYAPKAVFKRSPPEASSQWALPPSENV